MGLFGNNIKKIVQELKKTNEFYCADLSRDIQESFEDLKAEFEENQSVLPEFEDYINKLNGKLDPHEIQELKDFQQRFSKVNRTAKNGVDAMWQLSRNQRKISTESLRYFEQY